MSSLMLRSAIKTAATAVRRPRMATMHKTSLSTMALDDSNYFWRSAPLSSITATDTSNKNCFTSYLSNLIANLSGHPTLVTMDNISKQLENNDEGEWEEITSAAATTTELPTDPFAELSVWQISTLKRRKKMMNKHKLRKRRKKMRLKTRK